MSPLRGERGSITPLVPIVLLAFFILGGLVVDGSRDLNSRGDAQAYAEEAARAGATAVNLTSATLALNEAQARQRVRDYCNAVLGKNATVRVTSCGLADDAFTEATTCDGQKARIVVNTKVKLQIGSTLLGIVGVTHLTASGAAKARPFDGTTAGTAC